MKSEKVTFLGPVGATFSHDAYNVLAEIHGTPKVVTEGPYANCIPASSNGEIIKMICGHGGYGAIAMETLAEGRVAEPLESFMDLLKTHEKTGDCPVSIIGAIKMRISFCLMARTRETALPKLGKVLGHAKALGACRNHIASVALDPVGVSSNGEAARLVAESAEYAGCAALGPRSASQKYGLQILEEAFEDGEAITTFFLLGPNDRPSVIGEENRSLIVFRVPHEPGALVKSLMPFEREGLNLIQIHSVHTGNHSYDFAIEIEAKRAQLSAFERAMEKFVGYVERHIRFGPFQIVSR